VDEKIAGSLVLLVTFLWIKVDLVDDMLVYFYGDSTEVETSSRFATEFWFSNELT